MVNQPLFFNAKVFRRFFQEPEVKFLEEIFLRVGGSQPPAQDLGTINEEVAAMLQQQQQLMATIRKLELRINQLEDAQT